MCASIIHSLINAHCLGSWCIMLENGHLWVLEGLQNLSTLSYHYIFKIYL